MVKFGLQLKADLENLTNLRPDGDDFRWYVKLKCCNCSTETSEFQYLTLTENAALKGGRGHASMVLKCKFCSRDNSIDILRDTIKPYCEKDLGKFATVVVFDCRGVEPIDFSPRTGFMAEGSESGTPFTDIAFNEGLYGGIQSLLVEDRTGYSVSGKRPPTFLKIKIGVIMTRSRASQ